MSRYIQVGNNLDYKNTTGAAIKAGDIVDLNTRIGVAGTNIGVNEVGSVHMVGVFELPKTASLEINQGESVYYDGTSITKTDTDTPAGYAAYSSAASSSTVAVKLLG